MNDFKQCRVARSVRFFKQSFEERYELDAYKDPSQPAVFFGCYTQPDYAAIARHKGPMLMVWCGTDAQRIRAKFFISRPQIRHIAKSNFIARDLERKGLSFERIGIHGSDLHDLALAPLGTDVYVYMPKNREHQFAPETVNQVQRKLRKVKFHTSSGAGHWNRQELIDIYRRCAIGLRLTKHDGCANTVLELGVMGRKCVHNGDQPNAVPYRNAEGIARVIEEQRAKAGRTHTWLKDAMRDYVTPPSDWLMLSHWWDDDAPFA
jgi:hypothetical protein